MHFNANYALLLIEKTSANLKVISKQHLNQIDIAAPFLSNSVQVIQCAD